MVRGAIVFAMAVWPFVAGAQEPDGGMTTERSVVGITHDRDGSSAPTWNASRKGCCSRKHVLIGAAVGIGVGAFVAWRLCDAGSCTSSYITSMVVFGGIGAGIGALLPRSVTAPTRMPDGRPVHATSSRRPTWLSFDPPTADIFLIPALRIGPMIRPWQTHAIPDTGMGMEK